MNKLFTSENKGFIIPNIFCLVIIGITKYLFSIPYGKDNGGILIFSEFIIVPFLLGLLSAWFWKDISLTRRNLISYSFVNSIVAMALSMIFLGEGVICLLIVSPLLIVFVISGTFAGRAIFKKNNQTLNVSIFAMLAVIFVWDTLSTHNYTNMVADTVVIKAPPAKVWQNVVAYKRNGNKNKYWLFKIGMPSPIESTAGGYYVGASRKCIFSNGYVFDEKIVTYEENKNLTFDITNQPRDPEIMGHIDIQRGQFLLKDNGDGTTMLTGNSWYKLYVFPVWYYDIWAESITRNVHLRVMEHIKELSEAK